MLTDIILYALFFVIHFIGTLAFAPRVTGILSGRLALSISMSNILSILSRSASVLMIPILSKKIESELLIPGTAHTVPDQYLIFFGIAFIASLAGIFCFRATIHIIYRTVQSYTPGSNMVVTLFRSLLMFESGHTPEIKTIRDKLTRTDYTYLLLNVAITCIYTSATLAAIYSAYVVPEYRVTSLSFAFIINGVGTFIYVTMIDPYVSSLTDSAMSDRDTFPRFYFRIRCFIASRIVGVLASLITFQLFIFLITYGIRLIK